MNIENRKKIEALKCKRYPRPKLDGSKEANEWVKKNHDYCMYQIKQGRFSEI